MNKEKDWFQDKLDEIKKLSRIMTDNQLSNYYNKPISDIYHVLYKVIKTTQKERIKDLNKKEVIQIYLYLQNGERDEAPKKFFHNDEYVKILLEYLIKDILKWDRHKFINNFNSSIINKHGLYTIRRSRNLYDIIQIVNMIFDWNINMWELKNSNSGIGFWLNDENVCSALCWFGNRILEDKNVKNIYDAYHYGFADLISEYYLKGLLKIKYENNCYNFFENTYKEKFDIDYYDENYQIFEINTKPISLNYNKIIYKLTNKYYSLNDNVKKTLINNIIQYCEENKKFPSVKDLKVNNGYISYVHYNKYFIKYSNIFKYILPLCGTVNHCWNIKENRINYIKYYCEEKCAESILDIINSTKDLKTWTRKYFTQGIINKEMYWANDYIPKIYDLLIEAYPEIKDKKILFDWEWQAFYSNDNSRYIEILRELVLYRLNKVIKNLEVDIPKYLNFPFIETIYPKFNVMIRKGKFKNYYEWACKTFPEYKDKWIEKDFGLIVSRDNIVLSSFEEKKVYEHIKYILDFDYIKYIGTKRNGKYVYSLENISEYKRTCPDFVVEFIKFNNKKTRIQKPIIIEYYGFYKPNNSHYIFKEYIEKTIIKNQFYNSRNDIIFIDLYPEDLKNNCQGVTHKLNNVLLQLKESA